MLSTEQIIDISRKNIVHPNSIVGCAPPGGIVFTRGKGAKVFDSSGKGYFEFFSMLGSNIIGHGREEMAEAIRSQIMELEYCDSFGGQVHTAVAEYAQKLAEFTPDKLKHFHFTSGGSESNDSATKIAWGYWHHRGKTGKYKIISLSESYHGATLSMTSCTGAKIMKTSWALSFPEFIHIPSPNCYRCPFEMQYPSCEVRCAEALAEAIDREGEDTVAAFIIDPILTSGGYAVPSSEYFSRVREICTEHNVLLIADEVVAGFGRTGKFWAHQMWDIAPDMMTMAKHMTGGYIPLGAVAISDEIYEGLVDKPLIHGFTFSGHPVACVAGSKLLEILQMENLVERAGEMGQYLQTRLAELRELPYVGDVRGIGLAGCIELVADKATKAGFDPEREPAKQIQLKAFEKGVLIREIGGLLMCVPPYIITTEQIDWAVDILKEAIQNLVID